MNLVDYKGEKNMFYSNYDYEINQRVWFWYHLRIIRGLIFDEDFVDNGGIYLDIMTSDGIYEVPLRKVHLR